MHTQGEVQYFWVRTLFKVFLVLNELKSLCADTSRFFRGNPGLNLHCINFSCLQVSIITFADEPEVITYELSQTDPPAFMC